jgi:hypothetical protein
MATNAGPVYGKQYIRYAETFEAGVGNTSTWEMGEFRLLTLSAADGTVGSPIDTGSTIYVGVNQSYMPSAIASPQTARQVTVARSGLLLVEVAPGAASIPPIGGQLAVNDLGQADGGGTAVTMNGSEPQVREIIDIAGRKMVLVSFL